MAKPKNGKSKNSAKTIDNVVKKVLKGKRRITAKDTISVKEAKKAVKLIKDSQLTPDMSKATFRRHGKLPFKTKKKIKRGRPTKYNPKYCKEIIEYFKVSHTKITTERFYYKNGDTKEKDIEVANELPTFQSFAGSIGVHTDTLQEWKKQYKSFSVAYKKAQILQEAMWMANSFKGLYNPAFTIFAGKNMFGWRDKQEHEHGVSEELNKALDRLSKILPD